LPKFSELKKSSVKIKIKNYSTVCCQNGTGTTIYAKAHARDKTQTA
jgi:hypothetical protein